MENNQWIKGQELMDKCNLRDFELVAYCRHGELTPHSKAHLEPYKVEPEYNVPSELAGKVRITPRGINYYEDYAGELVPREFDVYRDLAIDDWGVLLLHIGQCLFRTEEVKVFLKNHFYEAGIVSGSRRVQDESELFFKVAKGAYSELILIWKDAVKNARSNNISIRNTDPEVLLEDCLEARNSVSGKTGRITETLLRAIDYRKVAINSQPKRYFREHGLAKALKKYTGKDLNMSEVRFLIKKLRDLQKLH